MKQRTEPQPQKMAREHNGSKKVQVVFAKCFGM